jgi:hypothetical protein
MAPQGEYDPVSCPPNRSLHLAAIMDSEHEVESTVESYAPYDGASPKQILHRATACRLCGSTRMSVVLQLGPTALANSFPRHPDEFEDEQAYPLDLAFCPDCSLVQIVDEIDPEELFRDYIYVTGTSKTIAEHNRGYAKAVHTHLGLAPDDLVVEIASNDGSLLTCFRDLGVRVLGVEPARNIAEVARKAGIDTVSEFFSSNLATELRSTKGPARAVVGNNVLAHVPNPADVLRGAATLLAEDGAVFVEVPYLAEFVERLEYDTVYHEHLCYFSVTALLHLCEQADLSVLGVDRFPVHGGTIRVRAGLRTTHPSHSEAVLAMAAEEEAQGLTTEARYLEFARDVEHNRRALVTLLETLRDQGLRVAGYGAPAKGNTLLNYCGIGTDLLPFTVDQNPWKVGRYTPGMHIPVKQVEALHEFEPDYVLILAWNFADEIMGQLEAFRARGGRFILPIPEPRVV